MLSIDKTRIILNGKILENVKTCSLILDFKDKIANAYISFENDSSVIAKILNFDVVQENSFDKIKDTVTWTQILCSL